MSRGDISHVPSKTQRISDNILRPKQSTGVFLHTSEDERRM